LPVARGGEQAVDVKFHALELLGTLLEEGAKGRFILRRGAPLGEEVAVKGGHHAQHAPRLEFVAAPGWRNFAASENCRRAYEQRRCADSHVPLAIVHAAMPSIDRASLASDPQHKEFNCTAAVGAA
jgi:hypothetical protein